MIVVLVCRGWALLGEGLTLKFTLKINILNHLALTLPCVTLVWPSLGLTSGHLALSKKRLHCHTLIQSKKEETTSLLPSLEAAKHICVEVDTTEITNSGIPPPENYSDITVALETNTL